MIRSSPAILTYAIENILREFGFADPVKMITLNPAILGYAIDNMRGKIVDMRDLGFADPVKMIRSSPAILGLAINNIRGRVADLRELRFTDPVKMITSRSAILGYARERLFLCGKIIKDLDDGGTDGMFRQLIGQPRAVIDAVAVTRPRTWAEVRAVMVAAKRAKL